MATTIPSAALVPVTPVFSNTERLALAGFLVGYIGLTRQAYELDLRQYAAWCSQHQLRRIPAAVGEALSRRAEQRDTGEASQQVAGGGGAGQVQPGQCMPVDQPAGMAEQVMQGDRFPGRRAAFEPVAYRVIHRQDASIGEQQHGRRGELLADRGDLEAGSERAIGVRVGPGCPASDRDQVLGAALEQNRAMQGT